MDWHTLTERQRTLCMQAQAEEREAIAAWLHQLAGQRLMGDAKDVLCIAAGTIKRNGCQPIPGLGPESPPRGITGTKQGE